MKKKISGKKQLAEVRKLLVFFTDIHQRFPLSKGYRQHVLELADEEAKLVSQIGRNKRAP